MKDKLKDKITEILEDVSDNFSLEEYSKKSARTLIKFLEVIRDKLNPEDFKAQLSGLGYFQLIKSNVNELLIIQFFDGNAEWSYISRKTSLLPGLDTPSDILKEPIIEILETI